MDKLAWRVDAYCAELGLLEEGDRVLVALSGGADSVFLLYMLKELEKKWGLVLEAAHLHHGLRGEEADEDLAFVEELCGRLNIPLCTQRTDIRAVALEQHCSVETAGREQRYRFLEEVRIKRNLQKIATAHQKEDQAETVLMHLLRGSGIDGLAGIPPRRGNIIRPLLCVSRAEIETWLAERNIPYRTDSTNGEELYSRNKMRLKVIPILKQEVNPNVVETLCRAAENARQQQQFLIEAGNEFWNRHVQKDKNGWYVSCAALREANITIGHSVFCRMAEQNLDYRKTKALWQLVRRGKTGSRLDLPGGIQAMVSYGKLLVGRIPETRAFCFELAPGEVFELPGLGLWAGCELIQENDASKDAHVMPWNGEKIQIRSRKAGDSILSGGIHIKLKQLMINSKIPRLQRDRIPVIQAGENIVWVYGLRHADSSGSKGQMIKIWIKEKS